MILLDASSNPNWLTIVISILTSGTFSYVITLLTANRVKKSEFDWAYKSYILEKRKTAYETLNIIMIKIFSRYTDSKGTHYASIYSKTPEDLKKINYQFVQMTVHQEWLSMPMQDILVAFSTYFAATVNIFSDGSQEIRDTIKYKDWDSLIALTQAIQHSTGKTSVNSAILKSS